MSKKTNIQAIITAGPDAFSNLYDVGLLPPISFFSEFSLSKVREVSYALYQQVVQFVNIVKGVTDFGFNSFNPFDYFRIRAGEVTIPKQEILTTEKSYKTSSITVPIPKYRHPNEISISFRVDSAWTVYLVLILWRNIISNPTLGSWMPIEEGPATYGEFRELGRYITSGLPSLPDITRLHLGALQVKVKRAGLFQSFLGFDNSWQDGVSDGGEIGGGFSITSTGMDIGTDLTWNFRGVYVKSVEVSSFSYESSIPVKATASFGFLAMEEPASGYLV